MPTFVLLSGAFVVLTTLGVTVAATYLGGGSEAVRRQLPKLPALAVGLAVVVVAVPLFVANLGLAFPVGLLALNIGVILLLLRQRQTPGYRERQRAVWSNARFWWLMGAYIAVILVGSVVLALAFR